MAIHAVEFGSRPRFAVELSITMVVLFEMAIHAVHSLLQMNVCQMDRFPKFIRVVSGDDFIFGVEQISLSVALVNRAENPAVTVKVGKLALFELLVKLLAA